MYDPNLTAHMHKHKSANLSTEKETQIEPMISQRAPKPFTT